jgi:hypothetical protein
MRVLDLMETAMKSTGSMKGQEEREVYFGRVFGCMALVRSGRLIDGGTEPVKLVVQLLAGAATSKSFLREISAELIGHLASHTSWALFEEAILPSLVGNIWTPLLASISNGVFSLRAPFCKPNRSRRKRSNWCVSYGMRTLTRSHQWLVVHCGIKRAFSTHVHYLS